MTSSEYSTIEAEVNGIEKVDIEVQLMKQDDFIERLLFYFSKTI